jgi:hypothetical protein
MFCLEQVLSKRKEAWKYAVKLEDKDKLEQASMGFEMKCLSSLKNRTASGWASDEMQTKGL